MTSAASAQVDRLLEMGREGDRWGAASLTTTLLDDGIAIEDIIVGLLAPVQHEVGERWHQNRWTVADEHLATGVTQAALEAAAATQRDRADTGPVALACAEGDWHSLPARLLDKILTAAGWQTRFLGASTPVDHLGPFLARRPMTAVIVTCSVPLYYDGAARVADCARAAGLPVLIGGRAVTPYGVAVRLGADAEATSPEDVLQWLDLWSRRAPSIRRTTAAQVRDGAGKVDVAKTAAQAFSALASKWPAMAGYDDRQRARTSEDLGYILRFAAASSLVQEAAVFNDFLSWQKVLLETRNIPIEALAAGIEAVRDATEEPDLARILDVSLRR